MSDLSTKKLVIYLPSLPSGGVERLYLNLTPFFIEANLSVTFLLDRAEGTLLPSLPGEAGIAELGSRRLTHTLPSLISYIKRNNPDFLLTAFGHKALIAICAIQAARTKTKHIATIHNPVNPPHRVDYSLPAMVTPLLLRFFLRRASRVVPVSKGLANEVARFCPSEKIRMIPNGVVTQDFERLVNEECHHPWLEKKNGKPTFVAAGRLTPQKDFETLLRAFEDLLKTTEAKLLIFGEGPERSRLELLARNLDIAEHVDFPGYLTNVFPAFQKATAFVLSSVFEGSPLVIAEALACGTPVISTNCLYGPSEILEEGKYGALVPVGDWKLLSRAMIKSINDPPPRDSLRFHGLTFSVERCANDYLDLFRSLVCQDIVE